eukprot:TRINITY_DN22033_c0_g1_i1.p1 TRINITY_DN22033_c0_g1~~TRINITY_DN22033_c0_g1_i1.p1  ORF type:complete len:251 (+),score=61.39 TRINITY_DN22033_c0_g1_i1:139-891(+)
MQDLELASEDEQSDLHLQLQQEVEAWNGVARAKLSASKEARKRAEADVQLLANRLALLRAEDAKAWRQIEEVRKRTQEVLALRSRNEEQFRRQSALKESCDAELQARQRQNAQLRRRARSARSRANTELVSARQRAASEQRAEAADRLRTMASARNEDLQRARIAAKQAKSGSQSERTSRSGSLQDISEREGQLHLTNGYSRPSSRSDACCKEHSGLIVEERELLARLRHSEATARSRRPPLPPVALEDE